VLFAESVAVASSASLDVQEHASLTPPGHGSLSTKITALPAVGHADRGASREL
jgi:hypothetical protein